MSDSLPTRPLGATGEQVSMLGIGGGHVAGAGAANSDREVVRVIQHAIDRGATFMDNAWEYNDGRSETLMGEAIEQRRDEVFLMTKVCARDRAGALSNLEDSLRRLRTDVIDLWQFHEINYATDDELVFAADGAAEAALQALADGKVRYVGCTGHKDPAYLLAMLGHEFPWSTVQMPVTVMDPHYKSFIRNVLPEAQRRGIGVIAMKTLGGRAQFLTSAGLSLEECLRFAWSQPISDAGFGHDLGGARGPQQRPGARLQRRWAARSRKRCCAGCGRWPRTGAWSGTSPPSTSMPRRTAPSTDSLPRRRSRCPPARGGRHEDPGQFFVHARAARGAGCRGPEPRRP